MARRSRRREQVPEPEIKPSVSTGTDVAVEGGHRTQGRLVVNARHNQKLAVSGSDGFADRMVEEEGAVLQPHHFLSQSAAQVAGTIPTIPPAPQIDWTVSFLSSLDEKSISVCTVNACLGF